jgi:outer membrane protein TolC
VAAAQRPGRVQLAIVVLAIVLPAHVEKAGAESVEGEAARPISLSEAEAQALSSSTELEILRLRTRAQARAHALGVREYLPRISLAVNGSQTIATGAPDTRVESLALTVEQPLFDGGRLAVQRALSRAQLLLDSRSYADSEDALVDRVRGLYWQALVQQEKLRIQEDIRGITARQVEIARMERRIGATREIDLVEAELEEARVTLTIGDTRATLEERMDQLRESLGMGPDDALSLSGNIDAAYPGLTLPADLGGLVTIALANNTELKRRKLEARGSLEALRAARAWFVPRISLALTVGISGDHLPLQDPSLSGELTIDFPSRAFPISARLSSGSTGSGQASAGSSGEIGVLEDIGGWTDRRAAGLAREESLLKEARTVESLGFEVRRCAAAYEQKKAVAGLARKTVGLDQTRVEILGRQLELGGIQRIDYMRAHAQLARDASELLEHVLAVLDGERELEKLLGLRAGALGALVADLARREKE